MTNSPARSRSVNAGSAVPKPNEREHAHSRSQASVCWKLLSAVGVYALKRVSTCSRTSDSHASSPYGRYHWSKFFTTHCKPVRDTTADAGSEYMHASPCATSQSRTLVLASFTGRPFHSPTSMTPFSKPARYTSALACASSSASLGLLIFMRAHTSGAAGPS